MSKTHYNLLKKEAHILSSLNHKNIVRFHNVNLLFSYCLDITIFINNQIKETDKRFFLVMELVHGGQLKNLIDKRAQSCIDFTDLEASIIMKQIFQAVSYMHHIGVVHRDLKPGISSNHISSL